ncbi:hypothetical protein SAMN04488515_1577 [Cognatiyoonia koreensis]|uniref:Uncharacterized protein n=1 Tax=Cognatiyoonia koreensis TaxID=364200 RepID=A0A1I0Q0C2_9RHOB|nr:hypothetical protein [Cognatiyoonia koreensis]SEW20409.1 hypothetical protein SAMN04488515_1577 [Cognatiyoonia koreensis]
MMKSLMCISLLLLPASLTAQTDGRISGTIDGIAIDAEVACDVGIWSEVQTRDAGDGQEDTDGDGFAMKLSGGGGTMTFGMFANDIGFQGGFIGNFDGNQLVIDQPYHVLLTGVRMPLDLVVDCAD